jgi:hypothetical protein
MATWKKLVVSGSNVSQLNNDAGYLTAGTITQANGYATASANGVELIASSATASLAFASSSGQGLTIAATSGPNTLTFGLSAIPNTSLANSSSTIGTTNIQLGATVTTLEGLTSVTSTNFTGSLLGTASYADNANQLDGLDSSAFVLNSQTSSMTVLSASYATNALSSSYALSSSFATTASFALNAPTATNALTASNITPAITNEADNRVLTANGGGTINGEQNLTFDGSLLNLNGSQTISGNLTVFGTASFQNTENLLVADRFVLLASGSQTPGDGGIVVQQDTQGFGEAFAYDESTKRWAVTGSYNASQAVFVPEAFMAAVIEGAASDPTAVVDKLKKKGNIFTAADETIWIYS